MMMGVLSLRLPDKLEQALSREAKLETRPRSEVIRQALDEYLQRMEQDRFLAKMAASARALANDPAASRESAELAETMLNEDADTQDANATWWK